jgi:hypothetical protein
MNADKIKSDFSHGNTRTGTARGVGSTHFESYDT